LKKANNGRYNNANPRGADTLAMYKKTVPSDVMGCFERAKAAHANMMENAPFFIGAVLAGNMVGLSAGKQLSFVVEIVSSRANDVPASRHDECDGGNVHCTPRSLHRGVH
jgi:uncharacterized MAPEG superfamily protein